MIYRTINRQKFED